MAYILVEEPIDQDQLIQHITEFLQEQRRRIAREDVSDLLFEDRSVFSQPDECDEALETLITRGVLEQFDDPESLSPTGRVLQFKR